MFEDDLSEYEHFMKARGTPAFPRFTVVLLTSPGSQCCLPVKSTLKNVVASQPCCYLFLACGQPYKIMLDIQCVATSKDSFDCSLVALFCPP